MGSYAPNGAKWLTLTGVLNSTRWPSDGVGGVTATDTASLTAAAIVTTVYGVLVTTPVNAATITLQDHAGTTLVGHVLTLPTSMVVPQYIPLGGPNGVEFPTGVSVQTSSATVAFNLYFDRVQ